MKSDKYIMYADIESLIKKIYNCKNNPKQSSTTKIGKHIPCRYSVWTIWAFDPVENKHSLSRREDHMKRVCKCLRE